MNREDRRDFWRDVCAPKLRDQKAKLGGRKLPEREIADYVEAHSGKRTGRALVQTWLTGRREPYISQFFALCDKLEVDPQVVLHRDRPARTVLRRVAQDRADYRIRKKPQQKNQ